MPTGAQDAPQPFPLTPLDRLVLAQTDKEFEAHTWEELKEIIGRSGVPLRYALKCINNEKRLTDWIFWKRLPSDLRRYVKWSSETKAKYGSVPNYVMKERLKWTPVLSSTPESGPKFAFRNPVPFGDEEDYKIMPNDWPYGMAPGIRHLIVWLKTRLESEATRGDMTPKSRHQIEDFVQKTFINRVKDLPGSQEKVMWFKNWSALQSVPGMEHVHVLVREVPDGIIAEWTGGEQPKQELPS